MCKSCVKEIQVEMRTNECRARFHLDCGKSRVPEDGWGHKVPGVHGAENVVWDSTALLHTGLVRHNVQTCITLHTHTTAQWTSISPPPPRAYLHGISIDDLASKGTGHVYAEVGLAATRAASNHNDASRHNKHTSIHTTTS